MAGRKKHSRTKHRKAQNSASGEALARAASEHLASGRFRDAVDSYKRLVKEERRPQWVDGLARAYAGRAEQLASRGMEKEAIALWHNRAEACGKPLADPRYLDWLLASGRTPEAMRLYIHDSEALAGSEGLDRLRARLAAAALAHGGDALEQLSVDDPIARDFAAADAALIAYARGDDSALEAALSHIAFRSPYKDFRQLLKAMVRRERDPAAAAELLARVPANTPFAGLRSVLKITTPTIEPVWPAVATLPARILDAVAALAGWSPEQIRLIAPLARLGPVPNRETLVDFILAHRKALGEPVAREAAFAAAGIDHRLHRRIAGAYGTLPDPERWRLLGRVAEEHGELGEATDQWQQLLNALAKEPDSTDNRLRRAVIHRHVADLRQPAGTGPPLEPDVVDHLQRSLELDPEDRDSGLRLVDHYLHVRDLQAARTWVDRILARCPDDAECLFKAAQTAVAGGAYKKAARFAHRLLEIDPINPRVRGLLVDAHLAHARKQIRAGKAAAARRELDHAAQWARSAVDEGRGQILQGLMVLKEDAQAAGELLQTGLERAGGGLVGRFHLLLEAYDLRLDLRAVTRAAALPAAKQAGDREQVLAVIRAVNSLRDGQRDKQAVEAVLLALAPAIDREAKGGLSREQVQLVCETLLRYHQYASLKRHAQAALRRWRGAPLFVFYRIQARLEGQLVAPWEPELDQLGDACERAYEEGDIRTGQRIQAELDKAFAVPSFAYEDEPDPDDPLQALSGAPDPAFLDAVQEILDPPELRRLLEALERDELPPPDILAKLVTELGGDGWPPAGGGARKKRKSKKRAPEQRDRQPGEPYQDDLFGDLE